MIFVEELDTQRMCVTKSMAFLPIMMGEAKQAISKMERHALIGGKSGHTVDVCYRKHGFPQDTGFPIQGTLQTS